MIFLFDVWFAEGYVYIETLTGDIIVATTLMLGTMKKRTGGGAIHGLR